MKLKNVKKVNKIVNELTLPLGCRSFMGTDFYYYYKQNKIEYSVLVSERMDKLFLNYAKTIGLEKEIPIFILSLLHEIGHSKTYDTLTPEEVELSQATKAILDGEKDQDCFEYFNTPEEKIATEWAIEFINNNYNRLIKWYNNNFIPVINKFYQQNNIKNI